MDDEIEMFIKSNAGKGRTVSQLYNERSYYGGQLHVVFHKLVDLKIIKVVGNNYIIEGLNFKKSIREMETDDTKQHTTVNVTGNSNVTNLGTVQGDQSSHASTRNKKTDKEQASIKQILIGVSIVVIAALILYYVFGIKP
jgi:hypothetical protein